MNNKEKEILMGKPEKGAFNACGDMIGNPLYHYSMAVNKRFEELEGRLDDICSSAEGMRFLTKKDISRAFQVLWIELKENDDIFEDCVERIFKVINDRWFAGDFENTDEREAIAKEILKEIFDV